MPIFSATIADRLGALREPNFRLFFLGQAVSRLGDGVAPVALTFAVLGLTHSPSDVGFLFAARSVPLVGFLLIGGVFGDRLPRRRLMLTADLVRFLSQGLVAALLIGGRARLWELLALQAVHGAATAFFSPALTGLMPAIVSAGRLQEANSLRGLAASAGNIAGPAL